jgi:hypothetical protein
MFPFQDGGITDKLACFCRLNGAIPSQLEVGTSALAGDTIKKAATINAVINPPAETIQWKFFLILTKLDSLANYIKFLS